MSLRENAARMAGRTEPAVPVDEHQAAPVDGHQAAAELPEVDIAEPGPEGPEDVPVHVAWSRVMGDVRKIGKADYQTQAKYNFRGVDRVLNVYGPATRRHGVLVLPTAVNATYRDTRTSNNKPTRECTVNVQYLIIGPRGDSLPVASQGESLDSGDKGTSKALSVALRCLLLHGGLVPTGDPDPDSTHYERGEAPIRTAASYRDEALDPSTSRQRMAQMRYEVRQNGRSAESVTNETGDDEQLLPLIDRIGAERFGAGGQ